MDLGVRDRRYLADLQFRALPERPSLPCPFLSSDERQVNCWKPGGVCSLIAYELGKESNVTAERGGLITTCPSRFEDSGLIYEWIADVLLGGQPYRPVGQVNFLERLPLIGSIEGETSTPREVGRIDNILVVQETDPLQWCAVEIQAVYFSGDRMERDFQAILGHDSESLPFPAGRRRPDYRSSGPKRLMPQLQIKVPTLRRWGKKMAVVVDDGFFRDMGQMTAVSDISNCDVAWFVVGYSKDFRLSRGAVHFTTLEESVQGLVAG